MHERLAKAVAYTQLLSTGTRERWLDTATMSSSATSSGHKRYDNVLSLHVCKKHRQKWRGKILTTNVLLRFFHAVTCRFLQLSHTVSKRTPEPSFLYLHCPSQHLRSLPHVLFRLLLLQSYVLRLKISHSSRPCRKIEGSLTHRVHAEILRPAKLTTRGWGGRGWERQISYSRLVCMRAEWGLRREEVCFETRNCKFTHLLYVTPLTQCLSLMPSVLVVYVNMVSHHYNDCINYYRGFTKSDYALFSFLYFYITGILQSQYFVTKLYITFESTEFDKYRYIHRGI